jgi:hypothetical protein
LLFDGCGIWPGAAAALQKLYLTRKDEDAPAVGGKNRWRSDNTVFTRNLVDEFETYDLISSCLPGADRHKDHNEPVSETLLP